MEVSMAGKIVFNGRDIKKCWLTQSFLAITTGVATKNLDVELIDKVQVYDDRENDPDHLIPNQKWIRSSNLKI